MKWLLDEFFPAVNLTLLTLAMLGLSVLVGGVLWRLYTGECLP